MHFNKLLKRYVGFGEIVFSYIAIISFLLLIQYYRAPKWKVFIDHYYRLSTLIILFIVSSLFLVYAKRRELSRILKNDVVRYGIFPLAAAAGLYFKLPAVELLLFLYIVYAILFIKTSLEANRLYRTTSAVTNRFLDSLFDVESRTPAALALLLLVSLPLLMIMNKIAVAEQIAVYVYYLLVTTVILQIWESKLNVNKENRLLALLSAAYRTFLSKAAEAEKRARIYDAIRKAGKKIVTSSKTKHLIFFVIILAGLYATKVYYWRTVTLALSNNPEHRSIISLNAADNGIYMFPSYADEITVPVKVKHPISNPLWWPNSGTGAVSICIEWYSGSEADGRKTLFEDYQPIPKPLFINDSTDATIKMKRPFVQSGNTYEVWIGLASGGNKWFASNGENALRLHVQIEKLSGDKAIDYEQKAHDLLRNIVEEEMSERLSSSAYNYRSKLEIMQDVLLSSKATHRISVTNTGRLPWPAHNKHAVKLGIAWMQKIDDGAGVRFIHAAVDTYPLPQVLLPGKSTTIDVSIDPRKEQEADEIWIGMVHDGITWFYNRGDAVIKLPNIKKQLAQRLTDLQEENVALEKELINLRGKGAHLPGLHEGMASSRNNDYRSRIVLVEDLSTDRILVVANKLPISLELTNKGNIPWAPSNELNKYPVNLGVLWFNKSENVTFASPRILEERCIFPFNILKDMTIRMQCAIGEKVLPGKYEVWVGLVHEHTAWFYEKGDAVLKLDVTVR